MVIKPAKSRVGDDPARQEVPPSIITDSGVSLENNMTKIVKTFIEGLEDETKSIDIKSILTADDIKIFEKWVGIFNSITPFTITDGLKKIESSNKLSRKDEVILISYIKFFEQKLKHLKLEVDKVKKRTSKTKDFDGSYYA